MQQPQLDTFGVLQVLFLPKEWHRCARQFVSQMKDGADQVTESGQTARNAQHPSPQPHAFDFPRKQPRLSVPPPDRLPRRIHTQYTFTLRLVLRPSNMHRILVGENWSPNIRGEWRAQAIGRGYGCEGFDGVYVGCAVLDMGMCGCCGICRE